MGACDARTQGAATAELSGLPRTQQRACTARPDGTGFILVRALSGDGGSRTRSFSLQTSCSAGRASSPGVVLCRRRPAARAAGRPPPEPSGYRLELRLDERVSRRQRSSDSVPTVPHDVRAALTGEAYRRRVASLIEPQTVSLHR